MKKLIGIIWLGSHLSYALELANDELLLTSCQAIGHSLYHTCILTPPHSPEQLTTCVGLKASYIGCLQSLKAPVPLEPASSPDPYLPSLFSPCSFATGQLVMWDLCLTK